MIVTLDGAPVTGADDLIRLLTGERIGQPVEIDVLRLGKPRHVHSGAGGAEAGG